MNSLTTFETNDLIYEGIATPMHIPLSTKVLWSETNDLIYEGIATTATSPFFTYSPYGNKRPDLRRDCDEFFLALVAHPLEPKKQTT